MKRIDWFLLALVGIILLLIASGAAIASWSQPQITLTPGTWQTVEFANAENAPENLTIVNISAPDVLLPYVVVSPASIPPSSTENITIQFAYVPISVRDAIPQDVFSVQLNGLIIYLDLSIPLPENAENRWAEIDARFDALEASLMAQIESAVVRITALETAPDENWVPLIENLRENVMAEVRLLRVEIADLETANHENSSPIDMNWLTALLDNRDEGIRASIGNDIANLELDRKLDEAREENEQLRLTTYVAIAIAIIAAAIAIRRPKLSVPSLKPHHEKFEEIPLDDKISMLENEIDAMRGRGDPEDSIKEKESELWELRKQLKSKSKKKKRKGES